VARACQHRPPVFCLGLGLVPDRFQAGDALLQGDVVQICHPNDGLPTACAAPKGAALLKTAGLTAAGCNHEDHARARGEDRLSGID